MHSACTPASGHPSDIRYAACYSWCANAGEAHCDRCKCRACAMCQRVAQPPAARPRTIRTDADAVWRQLSARQRLMQPVAVYRTSYAGARNGTLLPVGCVGALRQPVGASAKESLAIRNALQRAVVQACAAEDEPGVRARLPALFFQEALHGAEGGTVFPVPAAMGSSWDPALAERIFAVVARDARALGSHMVLAPVLDLFTDGRFGRMQEGFGEDPELVAAFARAASRGLQGDAAPPQPDANADAAAPPQPAAPPPQPTTKSSGVQPMLVRSIEHADKNARQINSWIASINDLHRHKPAPSVRYSKPMPDIESLMQIWPAKFEELLETARLPDAELSLELADLVRAMCAILDIPVYSSLTESLHVLFTLYSEFKANVHFQNQLEGLPEDGAEGSIWGPM